MLVSLNWLKDYLAKLDTKIEPATLAQRLTMRGLSVARIQRGGNSGLNNVVVGKIEKIDPHPNAERLTITSVNTGESSPRQVVCGAKNISVGDIVPVALPGASLPGDLVIAVSVIRGVESSGMLCSGRELGISEDTDGILQLPKHSALGTSLGRLLGQQSDDVLFEFELTPNRGDCLSVMGIAREVAPLLGTKTRELKSAKFQSTSHRTSSILTVEIADPDLCPRYVARIIDGFKVLDAPDWVATRLKSVGQKCTNNIVDITNFVMLEYGAPLHAFDLRRVQSGTIRVAACKEPLDFTLLTGQVVRVEPGDILIQDGERPIALAGIMGGLDTQVEPDTTSILLEAACFNRNQIRKTAKRLGLLTESSRRFEKGIDPNAVVAASERAAVLIRDAYSANVYHPPIDTLESGTSEKNVAVDLREVRKLLGVRSFSPEDAAEVLSDIGIGSVKKSPNIVQVKIPTYRIDLVEGIDVIEEIFRLRGYDRIPLHYPVSRAVFERSDDPSVEFSRKIKATLKSLGFRETIHYSFVAENLLRQFARPTPEPIRLKNPISEQMAVMRTTLLPSLLETFSYNKNRQRLNQRLFEVACTYEPSSRSQTMAQETLFAAALLAGNIGETAWSNKSEPVHFYHAKGALEALVRSFAAVELTFVPSAHHPAFHPNRSAEIFVGAHRLGIVGEIHPHALTLLESPVPIAGFEINLDLLKKHDKAQTRYQVPSRFPHVELDIAVVVDKHVTAQSLRESARESGSSLLSDIRVFDVFEGTNIPLGKRSIGLRLVFSSSERTLEESDTAPLVTRIVQSLQERHGALLRT